LKDRLRWRERRVEVKEVLNLNLDLNLASNDTFHFGDGKEENRMSSIS